MWVQIILAGLIVPAVLLPAVVAVSFFRTGGGTRYDLVFYEPDRCRRPGSVVKRRYRSAGHALYRLLDTLTYSYPLLLVYLLRKLSPKFREKIMIVTAMANSCRH